MMLPHFPGNLRPIPHKEVRVIGDACISNATVIIICKVVKIHNTLCIFKGV